MSGLSFEQFMVETHGRTPFPWQSALVEEARRRGTWPSLVDVPTGLGKTSVLDVAVFLLALSACGEIEPGLGRRRIYLVVDRRIVVDQAHEHGRAIAQALAAAAPGTVCWEVASRLRSLAGAEKGEPALHVVRMRGGVTWDAAWLPRPDLPAIITGTVDQVGSRLLFRGYGVSPRRRPIDAALVGTDSVILVDEAHLARALTASLESVRRMDTAAFVGVPATSVVHLTATAAHDPGGWRASFDEEAHRRDPVARPRLEAPKQVTLCDSTEKTVVKDLVARATELVAAGEGQRVLVVCNTVGRAREVYEALTRGKRPRTGAETLLLIGRSRPLDRELVAEHAIRLLGADRPETSESAIVVATQVIEVGIDLDATAMVTETASWDALVQRFGRVNRRGHYQEAPIVVVEDGAKEPPVYGEAKRSVAEFLRGQTQPLDVSALALRRLQVPENLTAAKPLLPLLLPAHLDAWARTSPAPTNDPPVEPYLHGIDQSTAPVTVAWRDGLVDGEEPLPPGIAGATIDEMPVRAEECVDIPLGALRAWLAERSCPVADLDEDIPFGDEDSSHWVLRRSEDTWQWCDGSGLRPGDTVIVPTSSGGLDRFGWNPVSEAPVLDVAELAAVRRGQLALRLDRGLGARLGLEQPVELSDLVADWRNCDEPDEQQVLRASVCSLVRDWIATRGDSPGVIGPWTTHDLDCLVELLTEGPLILTSSGSGWPILRQAKPTAGWQGVDEASAADSSTMNQRVSLATHLEAVGRRAAAIATHLRLPERVRRTVVDAARWHDLGKVDVRFQAMLFGGSSIAAELASEPLAKSGMAPGDRAAHRRAQRLSGLPHGARHEAWSAALVEAYLDQLPEDYPGDRDLLLHLVASHHGHGRPLLPPVDDQGDHRLEALMDEVEVRAELPHGVRLSDADRFARLCARYGRWGLALLETIVRCADMTVSSEGS